MKSQDIAIVGILLAVGAIARLIATALVPSPIVPNFVIIFYCLAIMLIAPRFKEALGIGIVGGIISALISHSLFPPANLISEPLGAIVCLAVFLATKERVKFAPALSTLVATVVSGLVFIAIVMILVMVAPGMLYKAFTAASLYAFFSLMMVTIVLPTAILNTVVAQILYIPAARVLSRGRA
ncbi:MAG TPA: tryptophan transporter [Methanospirillum sp.]|uniref:tryptophan transporter n=1 Tax=Methanospirillum sp. TaxID=45200 RepID=UPI002B5783BA|nr:tryptophan transporter [Methanospirillum sp.]HWQ65135.1 tryptophan transporter [Methanospirillum sp.]